MLLKGVHTCGRGSSWTRTSLFQFQESLSPPEPCREERTLHRCIHLECICVLECPYRDWRWIRWLKWLGWMWRRGLYEIFLQKEKQDNPYFYHMTPPLPTLSTQSKHVAMLIPHNVKPYWLFSCYSIEHLIRFCGCWWKRVVFLLEVRMCLACIMCTMKT